MAAVGHFGCPKFTLDHISGYFKSIQIFYLFNFFYKMAAGGHFGCPKITFDLISGHFRSIHNFFFWIFWQNGCRRPFWMSENHFRYHFYPFHIITQLKFFLKFLTKWLTSAILDVRISLSIAFLAMLDRYATFIFFEIFDKMADIGHFGCPKFTFDRISGHFRSICNLKFFGNFWQNGCRRPFWMSEINFRSHFWPFQIDRPFWMSEIHFRCHFWPFQIHTELNFFWQNGRWRPLWMSANNFRLHFWPFQIDTQLFCWQNGRRRPFWMGLQC